MDLWPPGMLGMPLNRQQRLELIRIAKVHGCRLQECTRDLAEASKSCANCLRGAEKQAFEVLCEDLRVEQHRLTLAWHGLVEPLHVKWASSSTAARAAAGAAAGAADHSAEGIRPVYVQGGRLFCA